MRIYDDLTRWIWWTLLAMNCCDLWRSDEFCSKIWIVADFNADLRRGNSPTGEKLEDDKRNIDKLYAYKAYWYLGVNTTLSCNPLRLIHSTTIHVTDLDWNLPPTKNAMYCCDPSGCQHESINNDASSPAAATFQYFNLQHVGQNMWRSGSLESLPFHWLCKHSMWIGHNEKVHWQIEKHKTRF